MANRKTPYDLLRRRIAAGNTDYLTGRMDEPLTIEGQVAITDSKVSSLSDMTNGGIGKYRLLVPRNWRFDVYRINVYLEDTAELRADYYGSTSALTNGIRLQVKKVYGVFDMSPIPITRIGHWGLITGFGFQVSNFATGSNYFMASWMPEKLDDAIQLLGSDGEELIADVQDDLSGYCASHFITVQGTVNYVG